MSDISVQEKLLAEFTEEYMEKIFYFCLKRTGNNFEAEDLTQDIAINVFCEINFWCFHIKSPKNIIPNKFTSNNLYDVSK